MNVTSEEFIKNNRVICQSVSLHLRAIMEVLKEYFPEDNLLVEAGEVYEKLDELLDQSEIVTQAYVDLFHQNLVDIEEIALERLSTFNIDQDKLDDLVFEKMT